MTSRECFEEKISPEPTTGCWLWTGGLSDTGYGTFLLRKGSRSGGAYMGAHRAAWIFHRGAIKPGAYLCHKCDNRACVNPDHLFLGTQRENMQDCSRKERLRFGEASPAAKLTDQECAQIRGAASGNESQASVARRFGINQSTVSRLLHGKRRARASRRGLQ